MDYVVLISISLLGLIAGFFGIFLVSQKRALLSDTLAHATLPGIIISFMIFHNKNIYVLFISSIIFSMLTLYLIKIIKKYTKFNNDLILSIILSGFFGLGILLYSILNNYFPSRENASLDKYIFGQTATILRKDLNILLIGIGITLVLVLMFYKELKLYTFDKNLFKAQGFSEQLIELILNILIAVIVVSGIQMVGVVLLSSLIIIPSVVAKKISNKFDFQIIISSLTGLLGAFLGSFVVKLKHFDKMPIGSVIVVTMFIIFLLAVIFSYQKGIIAKAIKNYKLRKKIRGKENGD